ncbi:MAG: DUF448 domain-containing protein [Alphaproteobacteria bacterium]|nr:DUF448 domain-containing protein [Alphaproteobacteria bacterium]
MTAVMQQAHTEEAASDGMRRCLVSGEMKPRAEMIRFVIGPEGAVVPDLAEKLPGRGLWVYATAEAVRLAAKKNLFSRAAKSKASVSPALAETVTNLLRKKCLDLLGLAKGAGIAVLGETQTEAALRAGEIALYMHAADAKAALDNRHSASECELFSREEMGSAFGRGQIVYAGLKPHGLTEKMKVEISRLRSMIGPNGENEG